MRTLNGDLCIIVCIVLSSPAPQICGVPLRCISGSQLRALLRSGRSVDAERSAGGHAGYCGNRPSEARANWFLPVAGRQRPAGSQRGAGPVDGHSAVAAAVNCQKTEVNGEKTVPDVWHLEMFGPLNCEHAGSRTSLCL